MRKVKLWLLTLLMAVGGVESVKAQTDVTSLLVNPSFEYSAEGVAYTSETKLSSGGNIYGWTLPGLGSDLYDIQVTPKSSASTGANTFGQALPSDGAFYFYNRKGWSTVATSLTQTATLPAGKYFITVDYKAAEWSGYRTKLGFKVADQELINTFCAARFTATTTYFADVEWKTLGAWFTVEKEGAVKIEIIETLGGNDRRADICLDNVKLYKWDLNDETNYDNATKSNPMDVTAKFVTNPYFDNNKDGWTSTTGYQNNGRATNQAGAFSGGFYENWNGSAKTSGKMYQTLSGLPDGIFRVTAAAFVNNENANVSLYAGTQKTAVNNTTPSWYSVQTTVNGGSLEIGLVLGDGNAANWIGLDNVKLEYLGFDVDAAIVAANEQATAAEAHLSDKAYTGYISVLRDAIDAVKALNSETASKASVQTATGNLTVALTNVTNSVADYAKLKTEIAYAKAYTVVNPANVSAFSDAISAAETIYADASAETTAAAILSMQNYKTLDYTYITTNYTENSALGTWTEDFAEDLSGEGYVAGGNTYWNEWGSATRTAKQTVTLPAGDYAISAIGRGNTGTSGYLYYKLGDADPVTVDFLMKGNRGRGVDTSGAANFAEDGTYNCNGEGFGWEYRFLTFTLTEETTVELGVSATFASNWVSIYAPKLFTTEATVKSVTLNFINNELTNNIPDGKMNSDVLSALNTKKAAAQNASMSNTKEELNTILEELRTAIDAAQASVNDYAAGKLAIDKADDILSKTNVYTPEAYTTFAEALEAARIKYNDGTWTGTEGALYKNGMLGTGWHTSATVSTLLSSAWDNAKGNWNDYHVNTWSTIDDSGNPNLVVPTFEYWVGEASKLADKVMTATLTLEPYETYKVAAHITAARNTTDYNAEGADQTLAPVGVTLQVGGGTPITCTGTRVAETRFFEGTFEATGEADGEGKLTIKIAASETDANWILFRDVKYTKQPAAEATAEEIAALSTAISQAEAHTLGFDKDEYAPYNNTDALTKLAVAKKALANSTTKPAINGSKDALVAAIWTANDEDVDAVYNGSFAEVTPGANYPNGWTRTNGWGQMQSGLAGDYATAYYNQPGTLKYGDTGIYTMPLNANTVYELTVVFRSHEANSNNALNVSVLNEGSEGLARVNLGYNKSKDNWKTVKKLFRTGAAGNYVLKLENDGNTWMTGVSLVKAEAEKLSIDEDETYTPAEKYANVTFKRSLVQGWNGLVLPFDMTVENVKGKFSASKVKNFTGISYDPAKGVTLNFADYEGTIPAGTPFLVKADAAGSSYTIAGVLLPATGLKNITVTAENKSNIKYTFTGTYAKTELTDVSFALIQGNTFFYHDGAAAKESSAAAFRAYFVNESTNSEGARVSFDFGDDETTGITELAQPKTAADGTYYDLQGRKVETFKQKGIYIVNGRKVVK